MLRNAGYFSGTDSIEITDDYDVDLRNKYNNRRCADIKIGRTLYIDCNNVLPNEEEQYIIKEKQLLKYFELAEKDGDFFVYLFHLFFIKECELLTKRLQSYSSNAKKNNIKIKAQVNCLPISVNYLRRRISKCTTKIHLKEEIKKSYLVNPELEDGCLIKINAPKIGPIINLKHQYLMLDQKEKEILQVLP